MGKYVLKRLLHGAVSAVIVVLIVMVLIYSMLDRNKIFSGDPAYSHMTSNSRTTYEYTRWEAYGYVDYVPYADYLRALVKAGELDTETQKTAASLGRTPDKDSELTTEYTAKFREYYESQGYQVIRLNADTRKNGQLKDGGGPVMFATKDIPLAQRAITYFTKMFQIDNIHYVPEEIDIGERGLTFTLHDPVYGGEKFSPAIIGNGTRHKYLLYFNDQFPYLHQNLLTINLGESFTVNQGVDVFTTMTETQGVYVLSTVTYPTGAVLERADDLHTATYVEGSRDSIASNAERFEDDYTNVQTIKGGLSRMGYSFVIGIISVIMAYVLGLPIGLLMSRYKEGLLDKIGTMYIIFIIATPSLAYIFMFRAIGGAVFGLPTLFDMESGNKLMYVLPIVSLALPSIANLMKWMRRYMIDQMNSDYVKFARSGGLTETEIFAKHIWKNAMIPITHGIPASVIGAMTGAIITERLYLVPGAGNLLTTAINRYDNAVIVGVTFFYAVLSVVSIVLGDVLMATVDPRISFTDKAR
ncbi:MAG: ABC transporter permease [Oscillibacter sp.]|nr:ABC transporter permease [Oscillibacter sp.]